MNALQERQIDCPYCGEAIDVLLDGSSLLGNEQSDEYIEDCQVCCRPILFALRLDYAGDLELSVGQENDTF